jgi:hypothetical protein
LSALTLRVVARAALACALGIAAACTVAGEADAQHAHSAASITDARVDDPVMMKERAALLASAEAALARGDTEAALSTFERAAGMLHAPDTEMGIVRSQMQAGQYRRALAFAAHTAGAHLEAPAASALYAWLLHIGGQEAYAKRVLGEALQRGGDVDSSTLREAGAALAPTASATTASGRLLDVPQRMAPYPLWPGAAAPRDGTALRVAASGVLLDGGRLALVPSREVANARHVWVRNGLGRSVSAVPVASDAATPFMLLRLASPLANGGASPPANDVAMSLAVAPRDPFAGSPGFAIDYAAGSDATPQWPWLHAGFFGAVESGTQQRRLGIAMRPGASGSAVVFDAAGRWAGLALPAQEPGAEPRWWPVSALRDRLGVAWPASLGAPPDAASSPAPGARLGADEVYERALISVVQVLVEP